MGTGQGGGKSGGGGRRGRSREGGGAGGAYENQHHEPSDQAVQNNLTAGNAAYADLPPVENDNRKIMPDGQVVVGPKGAPPRPKTTLDREDAVQILKDTGAPQNYINRLQGLGDKSLSDAATLVKGWKWEGGGAEGAVWSKGSKVRRLQSDGAVPLNHYNIGKIGAYSEWKQRYGTVAEPLWIEQKPRIWKVARETKWENNYNMLEVARSNLKANAQRIDPRITNYSDLHDRNWGWDSKGRARIIDPGAAVPQGAKILANW